MRLESYITNRKMVTETERQLKEKEAKRLALEKAQIEALIKKHKPCTVIYQ